jgi:hypothetical protein
MRRGAAMLAVMAAGCFDPAFTDATRCGPAGACPGGRTCVGGVCLAQGSPADAPPALDGRTSPTLVLGKAEGATGGGSILAPEVAAGCDATCTSTEVGLEEGRALRLEAFPAPGSHFQEWGGACRGSERFCHVTVDGVVEVSARFTRIDANLIFASKQRLTGTFGTVGVVDALCRDAAAEAGLEGTWIALVSAPQLDARDRLLSPGARGFHRLDGKPIADTATDLFSRVWYPVLYDQHGAVHDGPVWTGTGGDGTIAPLNCNGWTPRDPSASFAATGRASGGPGMFQSRFQACAMTASVYCAMVDKRVGLAAPPVTTGKLAFITTGGVTGAGGYDEAQALCDAEKPRVGRPVVHALLATPGQAASRFLSPDALYTRPDGLRVGTGAQIVAGELETGIWVHAAGTHTDRTFVWTGSTAVTTAEGGPAASCAAWSAAGTDAVVGTPAVDPVEWWNTGVSRCGADPIPVYCVEE